MASSKIQTSNAFDSWASEGNQVIAHRIGRIVYVTWSTITAGVVTGNNYTLATLPEKFRPINNYCGAWIGIANNSPMTRGRFVINSTSGAISWCGDTLSGQQELTGSACYIAKE